MLLEEFAQKPTINIDFHNHGQTGSEFRKKQKGFANKLWSLLLSEGYSNLTNVLDKVRRSRVDILYLTNFSESRFEDWTSEEQIKRAEKAGYQIEVGEYYVFAKKNGKVIALGKSQEVFTKQGHVLLAGLKREKKISDGKSLDETLKEANDKELKIADHAFCKIKGQHGILAYSTKREEDTNKADALEENGNFYFPVSTANYKARKYSKMYNKPLLCDSDGHHPKDIGRTYNRFKSEYLSYNSERDFRDSINKAVKQNKFTGIYSPIPPYRIFHHAMMIFINKLRDKIYHRKR